MTTTPPKNNSEAKEKKEARDWRTFIASGIFVTLILALMLFLTYVPIPSENKDLVVSIISIFIGGTGVAMANIFGQSDTEKEKLLDRIRAIELANIQLETRYSVLKDEYDRITALLVERVELGVK